MQFRAVFVVVLGLWAALAGAEDFRYRYVSVDAATLPPGADFFFPTALNDDGAIHGVANVCSTEACEVSAPQLAVYRNGTVKIRVARQTLAYAASADGTVGGSLLLDTEQFIEQAALFRGNRVERVPRLPGEFTSWVFALSDSGIALVESYDAVFNRTFVLYEGGESTVLDLGPTIVEPANLSINDAGMISGTQGSGNRTAFRYNSRTGTAALLGPLSTDPSAWGLDINNRGHVLGYSFVAGGRERIGIWDRGGRFRTYFVEGTEAFPTVSNDLLFNDDNVVVITRISSPGAEDSKVSYLVPEPRVRLNLADLVVNLPPDVSLSVIQDINNRGDMIGFDVFTGGSFLLQRIGPR